ncbi:glycosyltransferase WbuB [Lacrimispora indolis]|nr:glycosyltransferase WbuB [[Clostridium] methoxybenzovorans]
MKKLAIISCFDIYSTRIKYIENFFSERGYRVKIISSDFDHIKKTKKEIPKSNYELIKTNPYNKNISFYRIFSHYKFSKNAVEAIENYNPDVLWVMIPPNFLAYFSAKYKKTHGSKLIFDIIDMWPETMPFYNKKIKIFTNLWKKIRDKHIKIADAIVTECDLYKTKLPSTKNEIITVYMGKRNTQNCSLPDITEDTVQFCYLGSINNIIDIPKIVLFLSDMKKKKKVFLHIIGDGENKNIFKEKLQDKNINYQDYGKIFNEEKKLKIMRKCHFGINIMRETVFVGVTMKSVDYFQVSLPVINTIKGDTEKLVNKYNAGINIDELGVQKSVTKIIGLEQLDYIQLRKNTEKLFIDNFSEAAIKKQLSKLFLSDTSTIL